MESPITTPTRAALLKPNFLTRGSPIKFTLSTPEKATLREIELDEKAEFYGKAVESKRFRVGRIVLFIAIWALRIVLTAIAIYLFATSLPC